MKKILLSILLSITAVTSMAKETVTIVYSWTASDPAANYDRTIAEEANRIQNKYNFVFDAKPGAGGTVASQALARAKPEPISRIFQPFPAISHIISPADSLPHLP